MTPEIVEAQIRDEEADNAKYAARICAAAQAQLQRSPPSVPSQPARPTAANPPPAAPKPAPGPCDTAKAKANIDWVFADGGAKRSYQSARANGLSAYDAVLQAQSHNPGAQKTIENCATWALNYLGAMGNPGGPGAGGKPGEPPLANRQLTAADCGCITVLPAANDGFSPSYPNYNVRNSCADNLRMTVWIKGEPGPTVPNSATNDYSLKDSISAGVLRPNEARTVKFTHNWAIYSITSSTIESARNSISCSYD